MCPRAVRQLSQDSSSHGKRYGTPNPISNQVLIGSAPVVAEDGRQRGPQPIRLSPGSEFVPVLLKSIPQAISQLTIGGTSLDGLPLALQAPARGGNSMHPVRPDGPIRPLFNWSFSDVTIGETHSNLGQRRNPRPSAWEAREAVGHSDRATRPGSHFSRQRHYGLEAVCHLHEDCQRNCHR